MTLLSTTTIVLTAMLSSLPYMLSMRLILRTAQADIFENHTEDIPMTDDVTSEWFTEITGDITGAEIAGVCERAVTIGMRECQHYEQLLHL